MVNISSANSASQPSQRKDKYMTQQNMFGGHQRFIPQPQDWWHSRDEIVRKTDIKGFTARISDLRKAGYFIECSRVSDAGETTYRIAAYVGYDTTGKHTCPTCTCKVGLLP